MSQAHESCHAALRTEPTAGARSAPATTADHQAALREGRALAGAAGHQPTPIDVLMGLMLAGGAAARLLSERGISAPRLEPILAKVQLEGMFDIEALERSSYDIAARSGAKRASSLHLLLAILRVGGSGVEALRLADIDPAKIRATVLRALTGPGPSAERRTLREKSRPESGRLLVKVAGNVISTGQTDAHSPPHPAAKAAESASPFAKVDVSSPGPTQEDSSWELLPIDPPRSPVLHREREIGRILDLLQTKTPRAIALVGDPGAGRSTLLAALAGTSSEPLLAPVGDFAWAASPGALLQGLHRRAPGSSAIVLDGASWLGPDGGDGPLQILSTMRAGRRWILALTPADMRRLEVTAPDLAANLETVSLVAPPPALLLEMLDSGLECMSDLLGVTFAPEVAASLLRLSPRYPSERAQPGRALAIAELAAARAARLGGKVVTEASLAEIVADATTVPVAQLLRNDDDRFRNLEARLADRVVGHDEARAKIASVLRRSYAGFRGRRPLASFLLLGPTGVGKTETARAISEALYDGESALVRIDLSEYSEPHSVARLIGSPPGYLGHEDGGQLTEAIRHRPASVVLLDELEKAHREVLLVLLQVLEDGRLTDGRGRTVDFSAAAVVMTSNLGSEVYRRNAAPAPSTILALARSRLPPELWNRIDEVLCYAPLCDSELGAIVGRIAADSCRRLKAEREISFRIDDSVVAEILRSETDRSLGARPLRRAFERLVEGPLAMEIVAGRLRRGADLELHCDADGQLQIRQLL